MTDTRNKKPAGAKKTRAEEKKLNILYGTEVTVLPLSVADAVLRASKKDIRILLYLSADRAALDGSREALAAFCERIGESEESVKDAISFWRGAGAIGYSEEEKPVQSAVPHGREEVPEKEPASQLASPPEKKVERADKLPDYTIEELTALLEERKNLQLFIDECQRAYGKMFSPREINLVLTMLDYLSLDESYVLLLLRSFGEQKAEERKSMHYIEKMAFTLCNDGIQTVEALTAYLEKMKLFEKSQSEIRTVFGMGSRAMTAKEKKEVVKWLSDYGYGTDVIRLAYEKTVNATGKPSVAYASKILERWHGEGMKTVQDIENAESKRNAERSDAESGKANFETNDFFEAALRRSYGDLYEEVFEENHPLPEKKED